MASTTHTKILARCPDGVDRVCYVQARSAWMRVRTPERRVYVGGVVVCDGDRGWVFEPDVKGKNAAAVYREGTASEPCRCGRLAQADTGYCLVCANES